jgi:glucarate dehydratase
VIKMATPKIVKMEAYQVAGHDCMLLNLSGAHGAYFTRNIVILTDDSGNEGVGEVPGGEKIYTKGFRKIYCRIINWRL